MANCIANVLNFYDKSDADEFRKNYVRPNGAIPGEEKSAAERLDFDLITPIPKCFRDQQTPPDLDFVKTALRYMIWAQFPKMINMPKDYVALPLPRGYRRLNTTEWMRITKDAMGAAPFLFGPTVALSQIYPNIKNTKEFRGIGLPQIAASYRDSMEKLRKHGCLSASEWATLNWGCRNADDLNISDDGLTFRFITGWCCPDRIIVKIGKIFRGGFMFRFTDEDDFGSGSGFIEYKHGKPIRASKYDPQSVGAVMSAILAEDSAYQFRYDFDKERFVLIEDTEGQ